VSLLPKILNVTDAASFRTVLTPLAFGSVFGSEFAALELLASSVPLPYELGGIEVTVNGIPAAILYVSPTQINFQVLGGVEIGSIAQVIVIRDVDAGMETPGRSSFFPQQSIYRHAAIATLARIDEA
jgi:uncharacterized protein (TIGR03437 family)